MFYVRKKSLGSFYSRGTIFYCLVATLLCGAVAHCESLLEGLEEVLDCLIDILVLLVELVLVGASSSSSCFSKSSLAFAERMALFQA